MTHEEYIKRRNEMLDRNEDGWLSRKDLQQAIDDLVLAVIGDDVKYVEVFRDITDDVDYRYLVKRPMAEKHKNELKTGQRSVVKGLK